MLSGMGHRSKRVKNARRRALENVVYLTNNHFKINLHCPKTFQQKFMLTRVTPNRAYFKSLYRAKNPYFASVKNLGCI
jgi:hypothetical protein